MKNLLAIITLSVIYCNLSTLKAQMVTYSGPVEYHLEMTKTAEGGGSDDGYNWNVSVDEKRLIDATFYVTFTGGASGMSGLSAFKLTSIEESIDFVNTVNNTGADQKSSQPCYNDLMQFTHNAKPGDSRTRSTAVVSSRIKTDKPVIDGGTLMFRGDEYFIQMAGKLKMNITSENYSEESYPCLDEQTPPQSMSNTTTYDFPISIGTKMKIGNLNYLEGTHVLKNTVSDKCNQCIPGELARLVHGDMECSNISKISTSWMLVKRSKECDANVTYIKGDVKINGVQAKEGVAKVGAGDIIETGEKSRVSISMNNRNEIYQLGSKSKLQLANPCKPNIINPSEKGQAVINLLFGKIFSQRNPGNYTRDDFESDKEWGHHQSIHINWFRTAIAGVRGWLLKAPTVYFASINPKMDYTIFSPPDSEKEELIPEYSTIPKDANAFYIHFENGDVQDLTVVKGSFKIEDDMGIRSMDVFEGTTLNQWYDGTQMTEITILTK